MLSVLEEIVIGGAKIVGLTTATMPELLKKSRVTGEPNPHKTVKRITNRTVIIACNYENCVNNQREREDIPRDFVAEELWKGKGKHVEGHPFLVEHTETGEQYVAMMNLKIHADQWEDDNGNIIDPTTLTDYMKKENHKKQGTEKPVRWRTIKVENIVAVRYAGDEFHEPVDGGEASCE